MTGNNPVMNIKMNGGPMAAPGDLLFPGAKENMCEFLYALTLEGGAFLIVLLQVLLERGMH